MQRILKTLFIAIISILIFDSCKNDDIELYNPNEQLRFDSIAIRQYVQNNDIDAQRDPNTGIWYELIEEGQPGSFTYTVKDTVNAKFLWANARVKYQGKLLSGKEFDKFQADTGINFVVAAQLNNNYPLGGSSLIPAWIYAFAPKMLGDFKTNGFFSDGLQKGAKIRIITPSYWAYQNRGSGAIPANSPLEFIIEVLDIQKNRTSKPALSN